MFSHHIKKSFLLLLLSLALISSLSLVQTRQVTAQEEQRTETPTDILLHETNEGEESIYEEKTVEPEFSAVTVKGSVVQELERIPAEYPDGTSTIIQILEVELTTGEKVITELERLATDTTAQYGPGSKVILTKETFGDQVNYFIVDHVRTPALAFIFIAFVALVIWISGMHGIRSLVGLASSFVVIFLFILPNIQRGYDPILVAIGGAIFIMLVTFYLSHGFSKKTTISLIGTFLSLVITGVLSIAFVNLAKLTGYATEETIFLQLSQGSSFNARGLLLAGIIIGTLGVLDDITLSQTSIVQELIRTNPKLTTKKLFMKAMNVGKDHIASLVNTLILVYTGGSLPLLLLFLDARVSAADLINFEIIAEEVVRTLVGSMGLVLAVPITTFIACQLKDTLLKDKSSGHSHHH